MNNVWPNELFLIHYSLYPIHWLVAVYLDFVHGSAAAFLAVVAVAACRGFVPAPAGLVLAARIASADDWMAADPVAGALHFAGLFVVAGVVAAGYADPAFPPPVIAASDGRAAAVAGFFLYPCACGWFFPVFLN
jgi:hypothetical protein